MTIRDIIENIEIQGSVEVRKWDEENNNNIILFQTKSDPLVIFNEKVLDMEIKFMFAIDGIGLVIEVE